LLEGAESKERTEGKRPGVVKNKILYSPIKKGHQKAALTNLYEQA
jgi:hypothetical protein